MKCYKCGCGPAAGNPMFPVGPKGPGRRWICLDCAGPEQIAAIPDDVKALAYDICGDDRIKPPEIEEEHHAD